MFGVTATSERRARIAGNVRAELARADKTARFVAELLNLDEGSVSRRLAGTRAFKAEELAAIAQALNVPSSEFLERAA